MHDSGNRFLHFCVCYMARNRQDKVSSGGKDFIGTNKTIHRKAAGRKISRFQRKCKGIIFVFAGYLAQDAILSRKCGDNQGGTAFTA